MIPPFIFFPLRLSPRLEIELDHLLLIVAAIGILGLVSVYSIGRINNRQQMAYEKRCKAAFVRYFDTLGEVERYCMIK